MRDIGFIQAVHEKTWKSFCKVKALAHGTALLALIMLCGYDKSRNKDSLKGVYNPLNSGAWNFAEKKEELLSIINDNFCTEVDKELSVEKAMNRFWNE